MTIQGQGAGSSRQQGRPQVAVIGAGVAGLTRYLFEFLGLVTAARHGRPQPSHRTALDGELW